MNYLKIDKASINDGPGVRVVLWVAGCSVKCPGCHNPETWDFNAGKFFTPSVMADMLKLLEVDYIDGLTITGGNPVESKISAIIESVKNLYPEKTVWVYSGNTLTVQDIKDKKLDRADVIVDGPYIAEQRDITLAYRGSRNQRLIDVKETVKKGEIIEWKSM